MASLSSTRGLVTAVLCCISAIPFLTLLRPGRSRHNAWSAWVVRLLTNVKVVCTHHGAYGLERGFWKRVVARPMLWGDLAIMPSQFIMTHVLVHQRVPRSGAVRRLAPLIVIPRGVDSTAFAWSTAVAARARSLAASWQLRTGARYVVLPGRISGARALPTTAACCTRVRARLRPLNSVAMRGAAIKGQLQLLAALRLCKPGGGCTRCWSGA